MRIPALLALFAATALPAPPARAEPPRPLTLERALEEARAAHPSLLAAQARVKAAEADADVARAQWLPQAGLVVELVGATVNNSTATFINTPLLDLPRIGATTINPADAPSGVPYPSTLLAFGLRQTLFDFGRIGAQVSLANAWTKVERARGDGLTLDLELGVRQAYLGVLGAKGLLRAAEESLTRAKTRRDFVAAAVKQDLRPGIELTRAQADVERAELARLRAAAGVEGAQISLASAVGSKAYALDAVEAPREDATPPPPAAALEADAVANDPVLRELRARAEAARALVRVAETARLPSLYLTGALSLRSGGALPSAGNPVPFADGWLPSVPNYSLGVILSVPVLDFVADARIRSAKLASSAILLEADAVEHRLRGAARLVSSGAALAARALPALDATLAVAKKNQDQAEGRLREGLGTATELADAEALRVEAEVQRVLGALELDKARALLERVRAGAHR